MDHRQSKTEQNDLMETSNVDCPRIKKPVTLHIQPLSLGNLEKPIIKVIHVDCEHFERHSLKCKQYQLPPEEDILPVLKFLDNHYLGGLGGHLLEVVGLPYCRYRLDEIKRRLIERAIESPNDKNVLLP